MAAGSVAVRAAVEGHETELEQALSLHALDGVEAPAALTLGEGDRRLLALHQRLTGEGIEVTATCGECGTECAAVLAAETVAAVRPRCARLGTGGGLRQPTYADLASLAASAEPAAELLRRCTVGSPARAAEPEDLARVDDSLAGPLLLACAECGAEIEAAVDVERLVLERLQRHVAELDFDVHLLAGAYGWELEAIERLPDERRRRLARMVGDGR